MIKIQTVLFDIDGVLTDGMVYVSQEGRETKRISFDDINAIFELKRSGVKIGFITGEHNDFTEFVKRRFSPDYFISGCKDKLIAFKKLAKKEKIRKTETCFVGDSKKDLSLLQYVEYSFVPSDADNEIKKLIKYVTNASRGNGVIKEVSNFILNLNKEFILNPNKENGIKYLGNVISKQKIILEHLNVISLLRDDNSFYSIIDETVNTLITAFKSGRTLLICGNGGSAADAQHIAAEFVGRLMVERKALNAEALTVNTSTLTAVGNDYCFENIFSRQIEAKGKEGDVLLAISTSGNSMNVVEAIKTAKNMGMKTAGMTGKNKESLICKLTDHCICVPSDLVPRIQEVHILIGHMLCEMVEKELCGVQ
jgi:D-sedoheptulose 7-phosphate isomerase